MGKRKVALHKQVSFRDSFKDPVLDKIRKDLGELIEKQDRILQRFKKELSHKKQSSFTRELDSHIDKLQDNVDESRSIVSIQLGREIRKKLKKTIIDK